MQNNLDKLLGNLGTSTSLQQKGALWGAHVFVPSTKCQELQFALGAPGVWSTGKQA